MIQKCDSFTLFRWIFSLIFHCSNVITQNSHHIIRHAVFMIFKLIWLGDQGFFIVILARIAPLHRLLLGIIWMVELDIKIIVNFNHFILVCQVFLSAILTLISTIPFDQVAYRVSTLAWNGMYILLHLLSFITNTSIMFLLVVLYQWG